MATSRDPSALLTVEDLVEHANRRLDAAGVRPPSGQAAPRLTVRNVRYYASLGLIDPPAGHRGRQALYGEQHVQQLVAVRRLQADGLQLAEIERALAGADHAELARLAAGEAEPERFWARRARTSGERRSRRPAPGPVASASAPAPAAATPPPAGPPAAAPAPPAELVAGAGLGATSDGAVELARAAAPTAPPPPPAAAVVVEVGHGVALQVPLDRPPLSPEQVDLVLSRTRAALLAPTRWRRPAADPPAADQERSR